MRLFASLSKVEEQSDGSIKVYGIASTGARDDAGEIIQPDAIKAALPDYMRFGAIREMHQPKAAGTALECSVDEDGITQLATHIVDPLAIQKVKAGVYKGFSVGGKILSRDPNDPTVITKIKLVEISLVDRPCNPEAEINMWKAADIADPEGADMSNKTVPTNEEVKAHALELAKAAGKPDRANDYLVTAREELITKAAPAAAVSPPAEVAAAAEPAADPAAATQSTDPAAAFEAALKAAQTAGALSAGPTFAVTAGLVELRKGVEKLGELFGEDPLSKGMWTFGPLATAIQTLIDIQECAARQASHSKDDMQAPQMLAEAAQAAGQAMMQYVKEVLANAMAEMQAGGAELQVVIVDGDEAIALAAATVDLVKADTALMEKAGKRNSARDQKHIQAAHDSATKAGATCDPGNCPDSAAKALELTAENERLSKALTDAVPAIEALTKRLDEQAGQIAELQAQPLPSRTAGSSLATVEKSADAGGEAEPTATPEAVEKALAAMTPAELHHITMKAAMARPILIGGAR